MALLALRGKSAWDTVPEAWFLKSVLEPWGFLEALGDPERPWEPAPQKLNFGANKFVAMPYACEWTCIGQGGEALPSLCGPLFLA